MSELSAGSKKVGVRCACGKSEYTDLFNALVKRATVTCEACGMVHVFDKTAEGVPCATILFNIHEQNS